MAEVLDEIRARLEAERSSLYDNMAETEANIAVVEGALNALSGQNAAELSNARRLLATHVSKLSIGDDKLDRVRAYMLEHPRARQTQVQRGTKLNSGTVSVALRKLAAEGLIEMVGTEKRSQVWELKREQ